jgi:hypothetical protein
MNSWSDYYSTFHGLRRGIRQDCAVSQLCWNQAVDVGMARLSLGKCRGDGGVLFNVYFFRLNSRTRKWLDQWYSRYVISLSKNRTAGQNIVEKVK